MPDPTQGRISVAVEDTDAGPALVIHVTSDSGTAHLVTRSPDLALRLAHQIVTAAYDLEDITAIRKARSLRDA